jgi:short subunit dehydrogenase-like uncharacterized protein
VARVVLFGATGYTGRLVAAALVARGERPVLAARSRERAEALAAELSGAGDRCPVAEADASRPATVRALVERGDVLVSTVGPFARWGRPAVEAATMAGAHYFDSTGEPGFIRAVFDEWGLRAAGTGAALVTAFGYDWVPGNLAGALALREAGEAATRIDIGYFVTGSAGPGALGGGTLASAAGVIGAPGYAWRGGRLVAELPARHYRVYEVDGRARSALSVAGSEHLALPRLAPGLRDVTVHLGWFGPAARAVQALSHLTRLPLAPTLVQAGASRLLPGSTGGPDEAARGRTRSHVQALAYDAAGRELARVVLEGPNPYTLTGDLLACAAVHARDVGLLGTGALGPVEALGLDTLAEGAAAAGLVPR